jgi:hypothetical protein
MGTVYIEHRELVKGASLSWDIAHHLYTRQLDGVALVVTDRPVVLLASIRKQWVKIVQRLERERASTLAVARTTELGCRIESMKNLKFTAKESARENGDVRFVSFGHAATLQTKFHTIYVTEEIDDVGELLGRVKYHGLVVLYHR